MSSASFTGSSERATWIGDKGSSRDRTVYTRSGPALERIVRMSLPDTSACMDGRQVGQPELTQRRVTRLTRLPACRR